MSLARSLLLIIALILTGCASGTRPVTSSSMSSPKPLITVPKVELARYMGDWRVIAIIPYFAEKNAFDSIESYALRPDGKIDNWFRFRRGSFEAKQKRYDFTAEVVNKETNAEWKVRFLPFVKVPYLIIDLDEDYQWTVVGYPSRRYGWIMARNTTLPKQTLEGIFERLKAQGYDPARFVMVPQPAVKP